MIVLEAGEVAIELPSGNFLVTQSAEINMFGVDYVRIVDSAGNELGYWISQEWKDEPELVMGAIIGAMMKE